MPRRGKAVKREIVADAKYNNTLLARFINKLMMRGQKATAEKILYQALNIIETRHKRKPIDTFQDALRNATPLLEVKPRRVGGATYQVPVEVRPNRGLALAIRWLLQTTRSRAGKSMAEKLAAELMDAAQAQGATIKKKEDTHKMAEANRAFAHYRW